MIFNSEYLMQTGEWIYLVNESRTLKNALSLRSVSTNDALKMNLSGSQIVKMSLFPNKKQGSLHDLKLKLFLY